MSVDESSALITGLLPCELVDPMKLLTPRPKTLRELGAGCRVYWGSHGCHLNHGHRGPHVCCCECDSHPDDDSGCVGTAPYYGPGTKFYGEDA